MKSEITEVNSSTKVLRYRVNVSISTTGQKTWDCTVDAEGMEMAYVLAQSDELVRELEKRYPAQIGEK